MDISSVLTGEKRHGMEFLRGLAETAHIAIWSINFATFSTQLYQSDCFEYI